MTTSLAERPTEAMVLPKEQIDLIRRTVANGATDTELQLFLYDCARRGIHPLDKLLHFTKRGGKYTPVTSIDFMRSQAAMSGEMAGSDDPVFTMNQVRESAYPETATVTVYRMTQGQRFAYTATARWAEYCPDNAPMWKRMPHTMLGKCAEALALRKAFPQQLAGLYSREEMDQADEPKGFVVEAPVLDRVAELEDARATTKARGSSAAPTLDVRAGSSPAPVTTDEGPDLGVDLPAGAQLILKVGPGKAGAACELTLSREPKPLLSWNKKLADAAVQWCQNRVPVFPEFKTSATGNRRIENLSPVPKNYDPYAGDAHDEPVDPGTIPF